MSKLAAMIQAIQTNERRHVFTPLICIRQDVYPSPATSPIHYVVELKAEFGCKAIIQSGNSEELDAKLRVIRRQVIEAILGEFREDIHAVERALANYDCATAAEAISNLHHKMFDV